MSEADHNALRLAYGMLPQGQERESAVEEIARLRQQLKEAHAQEIKDYDRAEELQERCEALTAENERLGAAYTELDKADERMTADLTRTRAERFAAEAALSQLRAAVGQIEQEMREWSSLDEGSTTAPTRWANQLAALQVEGRTPQEQK